MTMRILVLHQSVIIERQAVFEPIYVIESHIESFHVAGCTHLKMTSGEKIQVSETPDEIIEMLRDKGFKVEGE